MYIMNLDDILKEWTEDCEIGHRLDEASQNTPQLHAKYLNYLTQAKLILKRAEGLQNVLLKDKFLWYSGKMSREEIDRLGWSHDPFDGLKMMKTDLSYYYESDPELRTSEAKITYYKTMIEALKEIVDTIKWRHQTIRNIIEVRKFEAGA
jgi:hypothetical protein